MTLSYLEALCRSRLTRRHGGFAADPAHSRDIRVPATRATALLLDRIAMEMGNRLGVRASGAQVAGLLLMEVLAGVEVPAVPGREPML